MATMELTRPEDVRKRLARGWDIGFTGTRKGMSEDQQEALARLLWSLRGTGEQRFHHGDNEAADNQAGNMAWTFGYYVVLHPPIDSSLRGFGQFHATNEPLEYLERNRRIVDSSWLMVAAPGENLMMQRSGTWSTIRYARRLQTPLVVIRPNGLLSLEVPM